MIVIGHWSFVICSTRSLEDSTGELEKPNPPRSPFLDPPSVPLFRSPFRPPF